MLFLDPFYLLFHSLNDYFIHMRLLIQLKDLLHYQSDWKKQCKQLVPISNSRWLHWLTNKLYILKQQLKSGWQRSVGNAILWMTFTELYTQTIQIKFDFIKNISNYRHCSTTFLLFEYNMQNWWCDFVIYTLSHLIQLTNANTLSQWR